jgi:hypothetical protein
LRVTGTAASPVPLKGFRSDTGGSPAIYTAISAENAQIRAFFHAIL